MASFDIPHFELPFRVIGTTARYVEQDSAEDVVQCVRSILSTRKRERPEAPDFGIEDPTFANRVDVGEITATLQEWEPRAATEVIESGIDSSTRIVTAKVASEES